MNRLLDVGKRKNICYNEEKSVFSIQSLPILGYVIKEGEIRPDPERMHPLRELPVPHDYKSLNRCLGFSYYSQWIPEFSDWFKPITSCKSFPRLQEAAEAFESLKKTADEAFVTAINGLFLLMSRQIKHASVEKEAQAIIEAVRLWKHFLTGRHITLTTDQKSFWPTSQGNDLQLWLCLSAWEG